MSKPERIDRRRTALIAYDVCRRALTPSDSTRRAAMRPVLDAWVKMIAAAREAGMPVVYTHRSAASTAPTLSYCQPTFPQRPACRL